MAFIIGIHASLAALEKTDKTIARVLVLEGRHDAKLQQLMTKAKALRLPIATLSRPALTELVGSDKHQGIAIETWTEPKPGNEHDLSDLLDKTLAPLLLILDGIQDPHNLGACLRSADATGVTAVIAPKDNAVGLTTVVCKVACGAAETVPFITVTNLARTMENLKERGIWLYGLSDAAKENFYQGDFNGPVGFVLGAEGKGLRQLTEKRCDNLYHLPMQGHVSSLNVSVATGVVLYEALRQRQRLA